jgi:peroxiredoxin
MTDRIQPLSIGEPAPWFVCRSPSNPRYNFNTVAGRYVALCFLGSAKDANSQALLQALDAQRALFDAEHLMLFNVSNDPADESENRLGDTARGIRVFWDFDRLVARQFGLCTESADGPEGAMRKMIYVLDRRLCVLTAIPLLADAATAAARLIQVLQSLPGAGPSRMAGMQAPVLVVPRVFSPELCRTLIQQAVGLHARRGRQDHADQRRRPQKAQRLPAAGRQTARHLHGRHSRPTTSATAQRLSV